MEVSGTHDRIAARRYEGALLKEREEGFYSFSSFVLTRFDPFTFSNLKLNVAAR